MGAETQARDRRGFASRESAPGPGSAGAGVDRGDDTDVRLIERPNVAAAAAPAPATEGAAGGSRPASASAAAAAATAAAGTSETTAAAGIRRGVETAALLALAFVVFRGFGAEAFVVPTSSMAPTLLGHHEETRCPACDSTFAVGRMERGASGRPICLNCGNDEFPEGTRRARGGDRVLVQKNFYELRAPRRWEVVVFLGGEVPNQPFVKRVIGLPGESVRIHAGDVYINGEIARKSLAEIRGTRLLVYDDDHAPPPTAEGDRPRWVARRGEVGRPAASGWKRIDGRLTHEPTPGLDDQIDWLFYRHWDPKRKTYGPIRDDTAYNGLDVPSGNRVKDLILETGIAVGPDTRAVTLRLRGGGDVFRVTIPVDGRGAIGVRRNSTELTPRPTGRTLTSSDPARPSFHRLEACLVDRRLIVALDGEEMFEPIDYDDPQGTAGGLDAGSPAAIGVLGGRAALEGTRLYRDIYYTDHLHGIPQAARGVDEAYALGEDEYFVLGDNSPLSNDSRFWRAGPVVRRGMLLGKPLAVHLPGESVGLRVTGRLTCWIPDPRRIRFIR